MDCKRNNPECSNLNELSIHSGAFTHWSKGWEVKEEYVQALYVAAENVLINKQHEKYQYFVGFSKPIIGHTKDPSLILKSTKFFEKKNNIHAIEQVSAPNEMYIKTAFNYITIIFLNNNLYYMHTIPLGDSEINISSKELKLVNKGILEPAYILEEKTCNLKKGDSIKYKELTPLITNEQKKNALITIQTDKKASILFREKSIYLTKEEVQKKMNQSAKNLWEEINKNNEILNILMVQIVII